MDKLYILETCIYADDLAAAERFYAGVLGLELFARLEGRHVFFRTPNGMLLIFRADATLETGHDLPRHGCYGAGHLAFAAGAGSLAGWRRHLAARGVAIEHEHSWPNGAHSLYFRDPAGNSVEIGMAAMWGFEAAP